MVINVNGLCVCVCVSHAVSARSICALAPILAPSIFCLYLPVCVNHFGCARSRIAMLLPFIFPGFFLCPFLLHAVYALLVRSSIDQWICSYTCAFATIALLRRTTWTKYRKSGGFAVACLCVVCGNKQCKSHPAIHLPRATVQRIHPMSKRRICAQHICRRTRDTAHSKAKRSLSLCLSLTSRPTQMAHKEWMFICFDFYLYVCFVAACLPPSHRDLCIVWWSRSRIRPAVWRFGGVNKLHFAYSHSIMIP